MLEKIEEFMGKPISDQQRAVVESQAKYTAFGGARGGGKTWILLYKAVSLARENPGIHVDIVKEYDDFIIHSLEKILPESIYKFSKVHREFTFSNGSVIRVRPYFQEHEKGWKPDTDVVLIDEAQIFLESDFEAAKESIRCDGDFPKGVYLNFTFSGPGRDWIASFFICRKCKWNESPTDYVYVPM